MTDSAISVKIPLTGGNIRNAHFYLREARQLLPLDSIGGKNKSVTAWPVSVTYAPGGTVETDIDGAKMIFRDRSSTKNFLKLSGAVEGNKILLERIADRHFRVTLCA
jgi:hypothetical protein